MWFTGVVSRRTVLSRLAALGGAGTVLPTLVRRANGPGATALPRRLAADVDVAMGGRCRGDHDRTCAEIFERQLDTRFLIVDEATCTRRPVRLIKVTRSRTIAVPGAGAPPPTPSFSLIFRGTDGQVLPQDTYRVEHPKLGDFPLFLVPIGSGEPEVRYQSIFA